MKGDNSTVHLILQAIRELEAASRRPFVKSAAVLTTAMDRVGLLTSERQTIIHTEVDAPPDGVVSQFYSTLIALVLEPDVTKRLVLGQGNFGIPEEDEPAAGPRFTECALTDAGRAFLAS